MDKYRIALYNSLCIAMCISMVFSTAFFGERCSGIFIAAGEEAAALKTYFESAFSESISANVQSPVTDNSFSPSGYGGGGYGADETGETPADIKTLMESAETLYAGYEKSGDIDEVFMGATNKTLVWGKVKADNKTNETVSIENLLNTKPSYGEIIKDKPYILVYHTHTTEGYELLDKGWYSNSYNSRTADYSRNMVRVGEALCESLREKGFNVIHDKTVYDTSYNGAYSRSRVNVEKYLEEFPSIAVTLDVHRDAIHYESGTKVKPTATVNGKKAAQVMIVTGCEGNGVTDFPDWKENLTFATHLQNAVEENYEGLMRPIYFCHRKYNMNVTPNSLLLEFGTDANTLEEAVYSASLLGDALGKMLLSEIQ